MLLRKIKKPKSLRQKLINANDDIFRILIHNRDKVCQKTGHTVNLQVAHFWSRGILRTRWDMDNACLLRKGTHYYWAHSRHQEFREFWIKRLGQKKFDELELKARYTGQVKTDFLLMMNYNLKKQLKHLTNQDE